MGLAKSAQTFLHMTQESSSLHFETNLNNFKNITPSLQKIGLSLASFEHKKITPDIDCAIASFNGQNYINPKYLLSNTSKKRSPANIYLSIKEMYGEKTAKEILAILQVSEGYLLDNNPNQEISVELSNDMLEVLKHMHPMLMPELLGISFFSKLVNTPFGKSLKGRSNIEAHEILFEEVYSHLEKSFNYKLIKLNHNRCIFRKYPNASIQDQLKKKNYYDQVSCSYQSGIAASISLLNNLPRAKVIETKCIHHGDQFCEYDVEFLPAR